MNRYIADNVKAGKSEKDVRSTVKSKVTTKFKPMYIEAYRKKNQKEMDRIRRLLKATGLYDDVTKTLSDWVK